ncbi:4-oxalocrotonate tautomerase [Mesobacillus zeae]|uniref:4-oxalocrotonate tautomerase n=1 Tax=Mesobacillus zeae TaxID=1917180 RepID=A0A398BJX1_9BACI|nr:4-oxalocrotonate tautomerase [Mesobacillus zeae]RID87746.1 4-oxalocrotonate tautomerase [Mesobacillus zeae]
MPIIQIQILEGRSSKAIRELISEITEATVKALDVQPEQVRIIVQPVPKQYWGVGGGTKEEAERDRV